LAGLLSLALLALLMNATTASAQPHQEVVQVSIRDFYFEPSQLLIEPGTTVQWVNEGATQHTVFATSPAGSFLSETLDPGETFRYTFPQRFPRPSPDSSTTPGTYRYICKIHPGMKATVTFIESGRQAPNQETVPSTQGREDTRIQQPPAQQPPAAPSGGEGPTQEEVPPTQKREDTTVQQPPTGPSTGGTSPVFLIGLLAVVAVGVLGWAVKRRSS
jgi:plastocyanin